ncbi:hypothetical protein SAMN05428642_104182 [Flaviramulus basaltis]|uniref:Uncharacterized protein n=1 Tax=Flaviramulus basaltis TaxID=369401 RepID=A0A1K2IQF8_9FLAO|nr:hypothetical protein [Flaviramulus basaltis]SFZ94440.1 hypothetical protein SAMN05428642_104182 [Flaviramulus basaltis]
MEQLVDRVKNIVNICWESFSAKVGCGLIVINKEASMQLQFAYLLKNTLDLAVYNDDEAVEIELETSLHIETGYKECDIVVTISKGAEKIHIPIELKCYKQFLPNVNATGGYTQFRSLVYHDISLMEQYASLNNFTNGTCLVMTNFIGIVNRNVYWLNDISNGTTIQNGIVSNHNYEDVEPSNIIKNYTFNWIQKNNYYFLKLEAHD